MKNKDDKDVRKTSIGGQAIIEGVMMRGPTCIAMAVRKPDNEIVIEKRKLRLTVGRSVLVKIPVLRGIIEFGRTLVIGMKALMFSADYFDIEDEDEEEQNKNKQDKNETESTETVTAEPITVETATPATPETPATHETTETASESLGKYKTLFIYFSVFLSLIFSVGVFILLPNIVCSFLPLDKTTSQGLILFNLSEGIFRIVVFFLYIILTSKMKEIARVWQYHGAEHKTIHAYEHGEELTVENVKKFTTLHPRCGTSFLFIVMIVSMIVFAFTGWNSILYNILIRIALVPLVAGISYEILKVVGRYDNPVTRVLRIPGLFFQRFTTKEPDDAQIEVAIAAFNAVLDDNVEALPDTW
jgi:uncharacterized protein YqhQ